MSKPVDRLPLIYSLRFWGIVGVGIAALILGSGSGRSDSANEPGISFPARDQRITPAGRFLVDSSTGLPVATPMTLNFVRTPDRTGPDGKGRFLLAVNGGYGMQFTSESKPQHTLAVIDLNLKPEPRVVQTVYFRSPQSAAFGLVFDENVKADGTYQLYLAGGFENKIWVLEYDPTATSPISPQNQPDSPLDAPSARTSTSATHGAPACQSNRCWVEGWP